MSVIQQILSDFMLLPVGHLIALIALGAIGVSGFAIFAMLSVTTRRRK